MMRFRTRMMIISEEGRMMKEEPGEADKAPEEPEQVKPEEEPSE